MKVRRSTLGAAIGLAQLVLATTSVAAADSIDSRPYGVAAEEASRSANNAYTSADAALRASGEAKRAAEAAKHAAEVAAQQNFTILVGMAMAIVVLVAVALLLLFRLRKAQARIEDSPPDA